MLEIYHGSSIEVKTPDILKGRFNEDFGFGFYCTEAWGNGIITVYKYNYLKTRELNILRFNEMTEDWLDFIVNCRNGKNHCYDIVEGPMADDEVFNYINDFIRGIISRTAFFGS